MPMFSPDFLTVFSMISLSSFLVCWILWLMGRQYWQQGLSFAVLSTALYGCAYVAFSLQSISQHLVFLIISKLLICLAISVSILSIQRFRQSHRQVRDLATVSIPILVTTALAFVFIPNNIAQFNEFHTIVCAIQIIYCLRILIQMRSRTPGSGWILVLASVCTQFAVLLLLIATKTFSIPDLTTTLTASKIIIMWTLSLLLFVKIFLSGFGFFMMARDRQYALEQGKEKLDYLTQLPNRSALLNGLKQLIQQDTKTTAPLTIMLIDIDHFQKINNEHGHLVGDQVIQMVAQTLQLQCRVTDIAARYSGKGFALLLNNTTIQGAEVLANRLCEVVRNNEIIIENGRTLNVTISIGVHCCIPAKNNKWEPLFSAANTALGKAKSNGRDRFVISTPSMLQNSP